MLGSGGFVDRLLEADVRNNSAWNHRFFLVSNTGGLTGGAGPREVDFALARLEHVPGNESAWNYVRGVCAQSGDGTFGQYPQVRALCERLRERPDPSPLVLGMMVDILAELPGEDNQQSATGLCAYLAEEVDQVRANYWRHRARRIATV